jgi:YVTN family beta-propeller protein
VAAFGAISLILLGAQSASAATPPAMPAGLNPVHVAVSPDGTKAYAANGTFPGTITVLDLATNTAVSTVGVGDAPEGIAFSPTQPKAYVTSRNDAIFSVVDTTTNTVAPSSVVVGGSPSDVAFSPDGSVAYVINNGFPGYLSVINTATDTVATTIPLTSFPGGLAFSPDSTKAYVVESNPEAVAVIDVATNAVTTTIPLPLGSSPQRIAVTADGATLYVSEGNADAVGIIDVASAAVTGAIALPAGSLASYVVMVGSGDGEQVFVGNFGTNNVSVIDVSSNSITSTVTVPGPLGMSAAPDGLTVYVAGGGGAGEVYAIARTALAPATPTSGSTGSAYSFALPANNASSFAVSAGSLPPGLTLDPATGVVAGTPQAAGTYSVQVAATGPFTVASRAYTFVVDATLAATGTNPIPIVVLSVTFLVIGGAITLARRRSPRRRSTPSAPTRG